jgi:WD40 repeat protein
VVDVKGGKELAKLTHPSTVTEIQWQPQGDLLAAGCDDLTTRVWHFPTGSQQAVLRGHVGRVTTVRFDRVGHLLATSSWNNTVRVWDPMTGEQWLQARVLLTQMGPHGQVVSQDDTHLHTWKLARLHECRSYHLPGPRHWLRGPWDVAISPDDRIMAAAHAGGVTFWDLALGREMGQLPAGHIHAVQFGPDGKSLLTAGYRSVTLWPLSVDIEAGCLDVGQPKAMAEYKTDLRFANATLSRDGRWLLYTANSREAHVVDLQRPDKENLEVVRIDGNVNPCHFALSPEGKWAVAGDDRGLNLNVWDLRKRALVQRWEPGEHPGGEFSPDGKWLVVGTSDEYQIREAGTWQLRHRIKRESNEPRSAPIALSPDSRVAAMVLTPEEVQLVNLSTARRIAALRSPTQIMPRSLRFTSDGSRIAVASSTGAVRVWDLRRIREQLAAMELDWDLPPYAPLSEPSKLKPLRLELEENKPEERHVTDSN